MARVAILDHERESRTSLAHRLKAEGHRVVEFTCSGAALEFLLLQHVDLIAIEWAMPDLPGAKLCRALKNSGLARHTPLLVVTSASDELDRILAFELGVDDYVTKPFSTREVALRIRRLVADPTGSGFGSADDVKSFGCVRIDITSRRVWVDRRTVDLTALQFDLLAALVEGTNRVHSRQDLLAFVWERSHRNVTRTIDTHVRHLRQKLGKGASHVKTVRGVGYRLAIEDSPRTA